MSKVMIHCPDRDSLARQRLDLITYLISLQHTVYLVGKGSPAYDVILQQTGAILIDIPIQKASVSPLSDWRYVRSMAQCLQAIRPEYFLGFRIKPAVYLGQLAKRLGVRVVCFTMTGLGYVFTENTFKTTLLKIILQPLLKRSFTAADYIFFQNEVDRQQLIQHNVVVPPKTHLVAGAGVNCVHYAAAPMPATINFVMITRLIREKGVLEFLQAAAMIKAEYPAAQFTLLAANDENSRTLPRTELQPYFDQQIVQLKFHELDVRPILTAHAVLVLPSYREGTPKVVLEAMAMARAVITTDVPGCRECVTAGVNGWLVPARSIDLLASAMREALQKPELVQQYGKASRHLAETKFNVERVNTMLWHIVSRRAMSTI